MRITKEHTIGLVVDIQERLLPAMFEKETLLKDCNILVRGLAELNIPLIATQQYTKGLGETIGTIRESIPGFFPIEKRDFSCCDEPAFKTRLHQLQPQNIIICGIEAHVCVLQTAVDLKEAGFNPIVVTDCISSRTKENVEVAKNRFQYEGIMTASYESILFELTRSAANPSFKAISSFVK